MSNWVCLEAFDKQLWHRHCAGSNNNGGGSGASDTVADFSPLGRPTGSTVAGFSERVKQKTSDAAAAAAAVLVSTESAGLESKGPGKGPAAYSQGLQPLAGRIGAKVAETEAPASSSGMMHCRTLEQFQIQWSFDQPILF
jgi:hypothetical protein